MRYGVMADVHANLAALDAAVERLRAAEVDRIVVAGDLVGYGPRPNECVDRLRALDATCIAGNHDLYACGRLEPRDLAEHARVQLDWTRRALGSDARAHLEALPLRTRIGELFLAHGSIGDPEEYITTSLDADRQLRWAASRTLVLGHTHRQWLHSSAGSVLPDAPLAAPRPAVAHLVNPGSVGQSRQAERTPLVRFAILDTVADRIEFEAIPYDTEATAQALDAAGLPRNGMHLVPEHVSGGRRGRYGGVIGRLGRRLAGWWPPSTRQRQRHRTHAGR
ncbi:MAG: metallophosphoesterase family protein [Acidimicrobiales bacterium]